MSRFPGALRRALGASSRLARVAGQRQRRALVLGGVLLAVSTATVWATSNTLPLFTSFTANGSLLNEGQTVTVSGTFTDPDASDFHSIRIRWGDQPHLPAQQIDLPPGQFSFQASHTYRDDVAPTQITATLYDRETPAGTHPNDNTDAWHIKDERKVPIQVKNVAPRVVASSVTVTKVRGVGVVVEGDFTDPGSDTEQVTADWSDPFAPGGAACTLTDKAQRHFHCEHAYHPSVLSKTYPIRLAVQDDDGGVGSFQASVQIP